MPSQISFSIRDYTDEYSSVTIPVTPVTAANFNAVLDPGTPGSAREELQAAIEDVIIGSLAKASANAYSLPVNDVQPASPFAQRELALRVVLRGDDTGKLYSVSIPTPDLANINILTGDVIDTSDPLIVALFTALTDHMVGYVNPATNTVEALTPERVLLVGRRN